MDPDEIKEATPEERALRFVKAEMFYVLIVAFVMVAGTVRYVVQVWMGALGQPDPAPQYQSPGPGGARKPDMATDAKELAASYNDKVEQLRRADTQKALVPLAMYGFKQSILVLGAGAVITLIFIRLLCGPFLPRSLRPPPAWGLWDVLKVGAVWTLGAWAFHIIFKLGTVSPFSRTNAWVADAFGRVLLVGVILHVVQAERGGRLGDLGIRGRKLLWGAGVGLIAFLVLQPFLRVIQRAQFEWTKAIPLQETIEGMRQAPAGTLAVAMVIAVVVAPLTEELFFRGFLQPALGRWVGPWSAIGLSAGYFAMSHMNMYSMPELFVLGVALGYVYDRTRSLAAPIALHMVYNAAASAQIVVIRYVFKATSG